MVLPLAFREIDDTAGFFNQILKCIYRKSNFSLVMATSYLRNIKLKL